MPGRRQGRLNVALPLALGLTVVLLALAFFTLRGLFGSPAVPDFQGAGDGQAMVRVVAGENATDIGRTLAEAGVVQSAAAFGQVAAQDSRSRSVQPGSYRLRQKMSSAAALDLLLDPSSRVRGRTVVPEGFTVEQTLDRIAESTDISLVDLKAAAAKPAQLGLPSYAGGRLEGFLFPATYDVEPGTTATQILTTLVDRYEQTADEIGLEQRARTVGRTPYEIVVVASLIEREVRKDDELPKVARVVYNRLRRDMPLQIDAAVLYGLGRTSGGLTQSDLDKDTPFNNRRRTGLPPTPIASPGKATLEAALAPAAGGWLYYVLVDTDGTSLFTADYDAFLAARDKARRDGVF